MPLTVAQKLSKAIAQRKWLDKIKGTARGLELRVLCNEHAKAYAKRCYDSRPEYKQAQILKGVKVFSKKYYKLFEIDFCLHKLF
jgi:hypothetical protein